MKLVQKIGQTNITIKLLDGRPTPVLSHFGHGIITWWLPYLFRTPPGYNMHVRGPVNFCKDGIVPLDAIVETDWAVASFPMSWRFTRIGVPIRFEEGEPICMISPLRRDQIEEFSPSIEPLENDGDLAAKFNAWSRSRRQHNDSLRSRRAPRTWQKHYFIGTHPLTVKKFKEHKVRLRVKPFKEGEYPPEAARVRDNAEKPSAQVSPKFPFSLVSTPPVGGGPVQTHPMFFSRIDELNDFVLRSGRVRQDVAPAMWTLERNSQKTRIFSSEPNSVFPPDLLQDLRDRLQAWGTAQSHGYLQSMQLTMLVGSCQRNRTLVKMDQTYVALPIVVESESRSESCELRINRIESVFGWKKWVGGRSKFQVKLQQNTLVRVAGDHIIDLNLSSSARKRDRCAILVEGAFCSQ